MSRIGKALRLVGKAILNPWKTYKEHVIEPRQRKYAEQRKKLNEPRVQTFSRSRSPIVPIRSRSISPIRRLKGPTRKPVLHRR